MRTILACGRAERSSLQWVIRGSEMSSAKRVWPVTFARASTRRRGLPMVCMSALSRVQKDPASQTSVGRVLWTRRIALWTRRANRRFDGFEDLLIAGAATQIARERVLDLIARRLRMLVEQRLRRDEEPGRAIAALGGAEVCERFLQRMQPPIARQPFDRRHAAASAVGAEDEARQHRLV